MGTTKRKPDERPYKANLDALYKNVIFPEELSGDFEATSAVNPEELSATSAVNREGDFEVPYEEFIRRRRKFITGIDLCASCKNKDICSVFSSVITAGRMGVEQIIVNCDYYNRERGEEDEDQERGPKPGSH